MPISYASPATVTNPGQVNNAGDRRALYLKVFGGEVLRWFNNAAVFKDKQRMRTLQFGKTAQFPLLGIATTAYHTPGADIIPAQIPSAERTISVDNMLTSSVFLANLDAMLSHFDTRGPYAEEMGIALALNFDLRTASMIAKAARTGPTLTGGLFGASGAVPNTSSDPQRQELNTAATFSVANDRTPFSLASGYTVSALRTALWAAVQRMDEKNITGQRHIALRPADYYLIVSEVNAASGGSPLLDNRFGGNGNVANASIPGFAGADICKSNNWPGAVTGFDFAATGGQNYNGDFSVTRALVWTESAVATLKLADISLESAYLIQNQGDLLVGKYVMGTGVLRPECAVEIALNTVITSGQFAPIG